MILGIYSRVSTDEQSINGISLIDQEKRGIESSIKYGFDSYQLFEDRGFSGTIHFDKRPGLKSLIDKILSDEIQGLFVVDLDRLSRNNLHSQILKSIFIENGTRLFDVNGEINLSDENQELLTDLRSLLSSFEIKKTSTRIKRALERNAIDGKSGGGPLSNYGYTKDDSKRLVIDDNEAKVVQLIYQLSIEGKGTKVIANYLNDKKIPTKRNTSKTGSMKVKGVEKTIFKWRDAVVYRILTNPIYKGVRLFKGKEYPAPAIIEVGVYDAVQKSLKTKSIFKDTTNKYFYLLKGLIHCGECQNRFYGRKREDLSDNQYICSSQRYKGEFCGTRGINIDYLDNLVWNELITLDKQLEKFYSWFEKTDQMKMVAASLFSVKKDIETTETRIKKLVDFATEGVIPGDVVKPTMKRYTDELEVARKKQEKLFVENKTLDDKDAIIKLVKDHIQVMKKDGLSDTEKRNIIQSLVQNVQILWIKEHHHIIIYYKIDMLTQFALQNNIHIDYTKSGWRFDKQDLFKTELVIRKMVSQNLTGSEWLQGLVDMPHVLVDYNSK